MAAFLGMKENLLLPLLSLLVLTGGALILWSARGGKGVPARRLLMARLSPGLHGKTAAKYMPDWKENSAVWYAEGLTQEERWQIVRGLAKFRLSPSVSLAVFFAARLVLAASAGAIAYFGGPSSPPLLAMVLGPASAIAGWMLPILAIDFQLKQHRRSVAEGLPSALELLAICVSVGLSLESALQRVAAEIKMSSPALSDEFALTWAEIAISPNREQALANLAERVNVPAVRSVIGTLNQSLRFGTPLTQSLRNAANDMRNRQMIELEEKANRLPALLTIPVMLFIMPTIFLIVGGPAALRLMDMFR